MNYRKSLEQAVIYIENHLGYNMKVEDVAKAAGYSYYHLNRQFTAILGESIGSYIKKRRLADASKKLLYTDLKIIDIAIEYGFDSPEAFSRAFKAIYKVSPQSYRQNRLDIFIGGKERLDTGLLDHLARNVTVHPRIVELLEIRVAGIRGETTLRDNRLRELWDRTNSLYRQIPNRIPGGRFFGICEACAENTLYTMNEDILFTEVAGTEVSSFEGLTEPFVQKVIPGGRYAVFTHRGTLRMLPQTFDYIWGTWFLTTKEELDWREDFELYDERFLGYDHPDSEVDLYIPVR
ncbi:AraC family transcriptional regulator [Lacrimispora celerecrescens]|uniref:AraC family transcriptional regulator n=1 Tax=[Clostridium] celerecrescens 18A TaxID=1286362 RepID=A0A2M8Z5J4_9FIRM|nr:AraC family transcriptional regulator [Lacrimispora celerecrescens]PJJ28717.1 AraC family transcriptional regulator [[Clostridium] celerecrescens 18A]